MGGAGGSPPGPDTTMNEAIFTYGGRPCLMQDQKRKRHPKFGWFHLVVVRYLDGKEPKTADVPRGKFQKARVIRGAQADVWRRADQLVQDGMEPGRALAQATAELAKGILIEKAF